MLKSRPAGLSARLGGRFAGRASAATARERTSISCTMLAGPLTFSGVWSPRCRDHLDVVVHRESSAHTRRRFFESQHLTSPGHAEVAISLIVLPLTRCSRRFGATVSTTDIPQPPGPKRTRSTCCGNFFSNDTPPNARCRLPI
jgi:hypothetical protein